MSNDKVFENNWLPLVETCFNPAWEFIAELPKEYVYKFFQATNGFFVIGVSIDRPQDAIAFRVDGNKLEKIRIDLGANYQGHELH